MRHRHVHLQYQLQPEPQAGEAVRHALFDMLGAVQTQGSIQHAARVLGVSYRHVWGALKQWEETLGEALVVWAQGQPARLTPLAQRLLWAETRARARLAPQIDGLRAELEAVWREALEGAPRDVLTLCASPEAVWPRLREVLGRTHALHLAWQPTRSGDALHALAEGRCDLAACHVPSTLAWQAGWGQALRARLKSGRYQCIAWGRRSLVWMCAPGNPLHLQGWADVVAQRARYVNRVEGSQTRLLADLWLAQQGVAARDIVGYTEAPEVHHVAVAAMWAWAMPQRRRALASTPNRCRPRKVFWCASETPWSAPPCKRCARRCKARHGPRRWRRSPATASANTAAKRCHWPGRCPAGAGGAEPAARITCCS
jgi:putative molybdopterin biosynthesis protein